MKAKSFIRCMIIVAALPLFIVGSAKAQVVLHTLRAEKPGDRFGISVSGAGDVNGDGFDDVIVGIQLDSTSAYYAGSARVFSGADGSPLHALYGDSAGDYFGWAVSGAGDVNADGYSDLIVGAFGVDVHGANSGMARVFSGRDGSVLHTFHGDGSGHSFGGSVSAAGDVNGDGYGDVVVGAAWGGPGYVRVFSGEWIAATAGGSLPATSEILHQFNGVSPGSGFGVGLSGAGDVNGDGQSDIVVGAPYESPGGLVAAGAAWVFSGADGEVLRHFPGDIAGSQLGSAVSGAGDVNGDSYADVIVGARNSSVNGERSGSAYVFSGQNGARLYAFHGQAPNDSFGSAVSGAGDVNSDGFADLLIGDQGEDFHGERSGSAYVFSGEDGTAMFVYHGEREQDLFGVSVSAAGDVNLDGLADVVVGAPGNPQLGMLGYAKIFSPDRDGDGRSDDLDTCPDSDLHPTVVLAGLDTGLPNPVVNGGCTVMDLINNAITGSGGSHGELVRQATSLGEQLVELGLFTRAQQGVLLSEVARLNRP